MPAPSSSSLYLAVLRRAPDGAPSPSFLPHNVRVWRENILDWAHSLWYAISFMNEQSHAKPPAFLWPRGKRAALSLTFDDGCVSQIETGVPILDEHGVKATFYVSFRHTDSRLEEWCKAAAAGHEIGCHTLLHPCSGNFGFNSGSYLEAYDLERMEAELLEANAGIRKRFGIPPQTFAYPCGQKFVGRGADCRSYVPLVARHFLAGRGFRDEWHNNPAFCDLAQVMGMDSDEMDFTRLKPLVDRAAAKGGWLVLASHHVGAGGRQTMKAEVLRELCAYASDPEQGVWVDTMAAIGAYVRDHRDPAMN